MGHFFSLHRLGSHLQNLSPTSCPVHRHCLTHMMFPLTLFSLPRGAPVLASTPLWVRQAPVTSAQPPLPPSPHTVPLASQRYSRFPLRALRFPDSGFCWEPFIPAIFFPPPQMIMSFSGAIQVSLLLKRLPLAGSPKGSFLLEIPAAPGRVILVGYHIASYRSFLFLCPVSPVGCKRLRMMAGSP